MLASNKDSDKVADPALDGTPKPAKNKSASICVNLRLIFFVLSLDFSRDGEPALSLACGERGRTVEWVEPFRGNKSVKSACPVR